MRLPVFVAPIAVLIAFPLFAQQPSGQPFRVFFDWSKPQLTRDGEAILAEVIADYLRLQPQAVLVAGHTDRSGSTGTNIAASRRRAEAVKAHLVAQGIPVQAIRVSAYGESRPVVPTEDGVREAQNRRVEISFAGGTAP